MKALKPLKTLDDMRSFLDIGLHKYEKMPGFSVVKSQKYRRINKGRDEAFRAFLCSFRSLLCQRERAWVYDYSSQQSLLMEARLETAS